MAVFLKILKILTKNDAVKLIALAVLCFIGAFFETISIGVIMPFMEIISSPDDATTGFELLDQLLMRLSKNEIIIYSCIGLLLVFVIKNAFLFFLNYIQTRFVYSRQVQFSVRLLWTYLKKPYEFFFTRNSADLQRNFNSSLPNMISYVMLYSVYLFTELLAVISIFFLLLVVDIVSAMLILGVLAVAMLLLYMRLKKTIKYYGNKQQSAYSQMVKWINHSINGIKEIKIKENYNFYVENFQSYGQDLSKSNTFLNVLSQTPRFVIEVVAISFLAVMVLYNLFMYGDITQLMPKLAVFAVGAYRLMPSFNRIMTYINGIKFHTASLNNIYDDLVESKYSFKNMEGAKEGIAFNDSICFENVVFRYKSSNEDLFKNVSFRITKGSKVGIIGTSGQGKSTLLDILLGLLKPDEGDVTIDGVSIYDNLSAWHSLIGYIPQMIYMIDDTIMNNITLGVSEKEISKDRVWKVLEIVNMKQFIEQLPEGIHTVIGENGICLSGGQRQRIAIARALYRDPQILIMDEATSALDNDTETLITDTLDSIDGQKTFIIVAHRLSTLKNCDYIYKVDQGKVYLQEKPIIH